MTLPTLSRRRQGAAVLLALALALGGTQIATASDSQPPAPVPATTAGRISENEIDSIHEGISVLFQAQLANGEVTYNLDEAGNQVFTTFVEVDGQFVEFAHTAAPGSLEAQALNSAQLADYADRAGGNEWYPKIWSGTDSKGRWVRFNRAAQSLMVSAAGTALKVAICAIPGVNAVGCTVVWGATLIAKQVIKKIGRCPSTRPWLYAYPGNIGASNCRK